MDVEDQRVRFVVLASRAERPFSVLCAEFGISRPTGYLWLGRYRQRGVAGLCELSRRPRQSPQQTEPRLEAAVVAARMSFPDWGARKLAVLLARRGIQFAGDHDSSHSAAPRAGEGGRSAAASGRAL